MLELLKLTHNKKKKNAYKQTKIKLIIRIIYSRKFEIKT